MLKRVSVTPYVFERAHSTSRSLGTNPGVAIRGALSKKLASAQRHRAYALLGVVHHVAPAPTIFEPAR